MTTTEKDILKVYNQLDFISSDTLALRRVNKEFPQTEDTNFIKALNAKMVTDKIKDFSYTLQKATLGKDEFIMIEQAVSKLGEWNMLPQKDYFPGVDGSFWILEAIYNNKYYFNYLWSPDNCKFTDVCRIFLKYTDIKEDKKY